MNDEHFRINNPANRTPKKKQTNLPPSLLSRRPSIHRFNIAIEKESKTHPPKKQRRLTTHKTHANPSHSSSTTNEKRTIDPSPALSRRRRKFEKKNQLKKKSFLRVRLVYMLYIHTYYTYLVPTYYTYMRSFCPFPSISQPPPPPRGEEKQGKGKKKRKTKKRKSFSSYLPTYLGKLAFSFFFLFFFKKIYRYTGTCRYLLYTLLTSTFLTYLLRYLTLPFCEYTYTCPSGCCLDGKSFFLVLHVLS